MLFVYKYLCECLFSVLLGIYVGVELLSHMVILCFTFWETTKPFFIAAGPFSITTSNVWVFYFFISLPILILLPPPPPPRSLKYSHCCWCLVISNCGFDFHFLMANDVEHLFMYLFHLYNYAEMSIQVYCLFFKWVFVFLL